MLDVWHAALDHPAQSGELGDGRRGGGIGKSIQAKAGMTRRQFQITTNTNSHSKSHLSLVVRRKPNPESVCQPTS
jgi:hypothetical protein